MSRRMSPQRRELAIMRKLNERIRDEERREERAKKLAVIERANVVYGRRFSK